MLKKIIFSSVAAIILLLSLCSCELFGQKTDEPLNNDNKYTRFIYVDEGLDLIEVRRKISDLISLLPSYDDTVAEQSGEIVFGNTSRSITKAAKDALEAEIAKSSKNDTGYIIYASGGSVAVYWKNPDMASIAIDSFVKICIDEKKLVLDDGIIYSKLFVDREYENEKYWLALESKTTPDVVEALEALYNYYNGAKIVDWLANLYDPEIGGFYYSISARDNEPFLPDLESTAQTVSFLINNNVIKNRNQFPEEIRRALVNFAREMQSPVDGYFYHPQWPQGKENLSTDRYGRDTGWATSLITDFTYDSDGDGDQDPQYPNWCAPNGEKCLVHAGKEGEKCSFPQTVAYYSDKMDGSVVTTVTSNVSSSVTKLTSSVVAPTASVSSKPDYSSAAAFSAWLEAYNASVKEDSGRAHNLAALRSEIAQKGYTYIVLDHLDRVQAELFDEQLRLGEEPTGLWQRNVNYKAVWGLLKYMSFYNGSGGREINIKYVPYIAKTVVKVIELPPDGAYASNDLYNQWSGISNLISNVRKYYGDSGVQQIYDIMRANCASLIANSLKKIEPFRQEDSSFSSSSAGTTGANIYGTRIAMGVAEGNVNSTGLICSMYRSIYSALGLPTVPIANSSDGEKFMQTLLECEPIIKNETDRGTLTFNSGVSSNVESGLKNSGATLTVKEGPEDQNGVSYGNSLYFVSVPGTSSGDGFAVKVENNGASCFLFESDIYVMDETDNTTFFQIKIGDAYMLVFTKSGDSIAIKEATSTSGGRTTIATVSTETWFRVRVEYYLNGEEQNQLSVPEIKVFVDEELVHTSNKFFGSQTAGANPKNNYTKLNVLSLKAATSYVYMDNIFCSTEDKIYSDTEHEIEDSRG